MAEPLRREVETAAGPVSVLEWSTAGLDSPRLHFAHATGMNAQVYARLLAPLAGRFHITASDARGHGHTRLPADPATMTDWQVYVEDLLALIDALDPVAPWLLAGHSMGGAVSALAAAQTPARVSGLVMTDPALVPFSGAAMFEAMRRAGKPFPNALADQAERRRPGFASIAEARAAYAGRGLFKAWADADLDAYLAGGLVETADGVALGCAPAWEAATFRAVTTGMKGALAALACPFALIAGDRGSTVAAEDLTTIAANPRCVLAERVTGTTHFVPLEAPDAVRAGIMRVADAAISPLVR